MDAYPNSLNNPLRFIDRDGRFSKEVHKQITRLITEQLGYKAKAIQFLVESNLDVDRVLNFVNNPEHGICDYASCSPEDFGRIQGVIDSRLANAVDAAVRGDYSEALRELGQGLHTVQDLVAHQGEPLIRHGGESKNDKSFDKIRLARKESYNFLDAFGKKIKTRLGEKKGQEIIDRIRETGEKAKFKILEKVSLNPEKLIEERTITHFDGRSAQPLRAP